jgi:acyl carrier protein
MAEKSLQLKIKECIINRLNLSVDPNEIDDDAPIFYMTPEGDETAAAETDNTAHGRSLELDSIDALEIVVGLSNEFGVEITDNDMMIFQSVNTITDFIREKTGVA